jgi:hypothetical protein
MWHVEDRCHFGGVFSGFVFTVASLRTILKPRQTPAVLPIGPIKLFFGLNLLKDWTPRPGPRAPSDQPFTSRKSPTMSELGHSRRSRHVCLWGKSEPSIYEYTP